jgi:hypothetical protein
MPDKPNHPPGPPMTLGNMRKLGVQNLIAYPLFSDANWQQLQTKRRLQTFPLVSVR